MLIVTLTTDFGLDDYLAALLKGAMLQRTTDLHFVDISHNVKPFDIVQGAFILKNAHASFPKGTLHVITVNNSAEGLSFIAFEHGGHYFVGPDNGIFSLIFPQVPDAYRLPADPDSPFPMQRPLANAVGHFAAGKPISEIGEPAGATEQRIALQPVISPSQVRGSVIYVDHYENVTVNIPKEFFEKVRNGRKFAVYFKRNDPITTLSRHYTAVPVGEPLCLFNPAGFLEIAVSMGKASTLLGLKLDDMVQVDFL